MAKETPGHKLFYAICELNTLALSQSGRFAYRGDMESISIDSSIGQCNLVFKAALRDIGKAAKLAGDNLLFHKAASKAFSAKSKFDRKTPYSAELAANCKAAVIAAFKDVFDIEGEILTSAAKAPLSDFEKYQKMCKGIGFSDEQIKIGWENALKAKAEEKPAEEPKTIE